VSWFAEFGGSIFVVFATLIILSEIGLHVWAALHNRQYNVSWLILLLGITIGFVGMFILNPGRAKDGGKFLVDSAVRVVQVVRLGRRAGDPMNVVVQDKDGNTAEFPVPRIADNDTDTQIKIPLVIDPDTAEPLNRRQSDPPAPPRMGGEADGKGD
jgi:hypothetical protein